MDISLVVAKVLGVYLVVSGLVLIFRGKTIPHLLKDFFDHPAIVYLTGAILVFLSTILLLENNIWDGSWRTIVTIFGWIVMVKGLSYILIPEMLQKVATKKVFKDLSLYGILAIVVGVTLFYATYTCGPLVGIRFY